MSKSTIILLLCSVLAKNVSCLECYISTYSAGPVIKNCTEKYPDYPENYAFRCAVVINNFVNRISQECVRPNTTCDSHRKEIVTEWGYSGDFNDLDCDICETDLCNTGYSWYWKIFLSEYFLVGVVVLLVCVVISFIEIRKSRQDGLNQKLNSINV